MEEGIKIIPLGRRVLVKFSLEAAGLMKDAEGNVVTKEGLHVPNESMANRYEAEIVSIGYGVSEEFREQVKVGDAVLVGMFTGDPYQRHLVLFEDEIICKLEWPLDNEEKIIKLLE
jgi:co-chaperonin GroES (HSP10)